MEKGKRIFLLRLREFLEEFRKRFKGIIKEMRKFTTY
jgi:hypothetical protein